MERHEFVALLEPLRVALGADFDQPTWTVYYRALSDVSPQLLDAAVTAALREDRVFMPRPGELRAIAEGRRLELMAAHPYERCSECGYTGHVKLGSVPSGVGFRVPRYGRCRCWAAYQARLTDLGIGEKSLTQSPQARAQIEAESHAGVEFPPDVTARVAEIARSRAMK